MRHLLFSACIGLLFLFSAPAIPHSNKTWLGADLIFQENESTLTEAQKAKLLQLVEQVRKEKWCPLEAVVLIGYSSPTEGTPTQAQALSSARTEHIANLLHSFGIPKRSIFSEGRGANRPRGPADSPPSSRVEIEFVGMNRYTPDEECKTRQTDSGFRVW